jgi:hypothetical protein
MQNIPSQSFNLDGVSLHSMNSLPSEMIDELFATIFEPSQLKPIPISEQYRPLSPLEISDIINNIGIYHNYNDH